MSLARAIRTGDVAELPSRRDEDWRWTDLRGLIRVLPPASAAAEPASAGPFDALCQDRMAVVNGYGGQDIVVSADPPRTLALRFVSRTDRTAYAAALTIDVEPDATLLLLESHEGQGGDYLADTRLTIRLGAAARLDRIVLADEAADAVAVNTAVVTLGELSTFSQTVITRGARRQRLETQVSHPGQSARVRLDGVYILGDRRFSDLTTVVTHEGVGGATSELVKGAVGGQGRAVFQGRIVVAKGADQTDARMGHHALILSDRGEVDAKPELLIYADDVSCAHGNTVGALDEDALFYARQRGVPEAEAKAMLTEAFVGEVIDRIEHEGAREICRAWVGERLRTLA